MPVMRAKLQINNIVRYPTAGTATQETLYFNGVSKSSAYPEDGSDEDNTFAKFSPNVSLSLTIANPALIGKFTVGEKFYLDFTKADE